MVNALVLTPPIVMVISFHFFLVGASPPAIGVAGAGLLLFFDFCSRTDDGKKPRLRILAIASSLLFAVTRPFWGWPASFSASRRARRRHRRRSFCYRVC